MRIWAAAHILNYFCTILEASRLSLAVTLAFNADSTFSTLLSAALSRSRSRRLIFLII